MLDFYSIISIHNLILLHFYRREMLTCVRMLKARIS